MICLFVTVKGSLRKQRIIARDSVSWRESLSVIVPESMHGVKVEFPSEEEFFGEAHTAEVTLL
jgi:hypothetical protein